MSTLQNCPADYVRNECLSLLLLITARNSEIQTSATFQGLVETIFSILEEEGLTRTSQVTCDLLQCLMNLISNSLCQKYIRESTGFALLIQAMDMALSGRTSNDVEDEGDDDFDTSRVPDEVRWGCLSRLVDVALAIAGGGPRSGAGEPPVEAAANQAALIRDDAFGLCRYLLDSKISSSAKLRLAELFEAMVVSAQAAKALQSSDKGKPLLFVLAAALLGAETQTPLRCALGRILGQALICHPPLQAFLCDSLRPSELTVPSETPAGRTIVDLLENAGLESERFWFAVHLLLATMWGNAQVQDTCVRLPIEHNDQEPETLLNLILRVFVACANGVRSSAGRNPDDFSFGSPAAAKEFSLETPAITLVAMLKLLTYWIAMCPAALGAFATSPAMVHMAMELTTFTSSLGPVLQTQIEGLSSFLLGICVKADEAASYWRMVWSGAVNIRETMSKSGNILGVVSSGETLRGPNVAIG